MRWSPLFQESSPYAGKVAQRGFEGEWSEQTEARTAKCDEVRELFSDHMDRTQGPAQEDQLGGHLVECASCREALREYESALSITSWRRIRRYHPDLGTPRECGQDISARGHE
jgi:hypothetical protein